jgi:hypothetical protein
MPASGKSAPKGNNESAQTGEHRRQRPFEPLNRTCIKRALGNTLWDVGNRALYDLCAKHPKHDRDDVIVAKIWLIGRSYAAAIERRSEIGEFRGDNFYSKVVAPAVRRSAIDQWIECARQNPTDAQLVIEMHSEVTTLFKRISGRDKPSLASKYLHFHVPQCFYIYDSRALSAIRRLTHPVVTHDSRLPAAGRHHHEYGKFFLRCLDLTARLDREGHGCLQPRELDKLLLAASEDMLGTA